LDGLPDELAEQAVQEAVRNGLTTPELLIVAAAPRSPRVTGIILPVRIDPQPPHVVQQQAQQQLATEDTSISSGCHANTLRNLILTSRTY
jgi:hypothetical protein